jgi:hypothetical protein
MEPVSYLRPSTNSERLKEFDTPPGTQGQKSLGDMRSLPVSQIKTYTLVEMKATSKKTPVVHEE